jgi:uncharacterized membrane protein YcgQ (UPF0703/DUF1980 family)
MTALLPPTFSNKPERLNDAPMSPACRSESTMRTAHHHHHHALLYDQLRKEHQYAPVAGRSIRGAGGSPSENVVKRQNPVGRPRTTKWLGEGDEDVGQVHAVYCARVRRQTMASNGQGVGLLRPLMGRPRLEHVLWPTLPTEHSSLWAHGKRVPLQVWPETDCLRIGTWAHLPISGRVTFDTERLDDDVRDRKLKKKRCLKCNEDDIVTYIREYEVEALPSSHANYMQLIHRLSHAAATNAATQNGAESNQGLFGNYINPDAFIMMLQSEETHELGRRFVEIVAFQYWLLMRGRSRVGTRRTGQDNGLPEEIIMLFASDVKCDAAKCERYIKNACVYESTAKQVTAAEFVYIVYARVYDKVNPGKRRMAPMSLRMETLQFVPVEIENELDWYTPRPRQAKCNMWSTDKGAFTRKSLRVKFASSAQCYFYCHTYFRAKQPVFVHPSAWEPYQWIAYPIHTTEQDFGHKDDKDYDVKGFVYVVYQIRRYYVTDVHAVAGVEDYIRRVIRRLQPELDPDLVIHPKALPDTSSSKMMVTADADSHVSTPEQDYSKPVRVSRSVMKKRRDLNNKRKSQVAFTEKKTKKHKKQTRCASDDDSDYVPSEDEETDEEETADELCVEPRARHKSIVSTSVHKQTTSTKSTQDHVLMPRHSLFAGSREPAVFKRHVNRLAMFRPDRKLRYYNTAKVKEHRVQEKKKKKKKEEEDNDDEKRVLLHMDTTTLVLVPPAGICDDTGKHMDGNHPAYLRPADLLHAFEHHSKDDVQAVLGAFDTSRPEYRDKPWSLVYWYTYLRSLDMPLTDVLLWHVIFTAASVSHPFEPGDGENMFNVNNTTVLTLSDVERIRLKFCHEWDTSTSVFRSMDMLEFCTTYAYPEHADASLAQHVSDAMIACASRQSLSPPPPPPPPPVEHDKKDDTHGQPDVLLVSAIEAYKHNAKKTLYASTSGMSLYDATGYAFTREMVEHHLKMHRAEEAAIARLDLVTEKWSQQKKMNELLDHIISTRFDQMLEHKSWNVTVEKRRFHAFELYIRGKPVPTESLDKIIWNNFVSFAWNFFVSIATTIVQPEWMLPIHIQRHTMQLNQWPTHQFIHEHTSSNRFEHNKTVFDRVTQFPEVHMMIQDLSQMSYTDYNAQVDDKTLAGLKFVMQYHQDDVSKAVLQKITSRFEPLDVFVTAGIDLRNAAHAAVASAPNDETSFKYALVIVRICRDTTNFSSCDNTAVVRDALRSEFAEPLDTEESHMQELGSMLRKMDAHMSGDTPLGRALCKQGKRDTTFRNPDICELYAVYIAAERPNRSEKIMSALQDMRRHSAQGKEEEDKQAYPEEATDRRYPALHNVCPFRLGDDVPFGALFATNQQDMQWMADMHKATAAFRSDVSPPPEQTHFETCEQVLASVLTDM